MLRTAKLSYGILIVIGFLLTLVALFTPGWRMFNGNGAPNFGLITVDCGDGNRQVQEKDCHTWFNSRSTSEKVAMGCLIAAAILEFIAVISFILIFAKARYRLAAPAAGLCLLAALLILIAILVYGIRFGSRTIYMQSVQYEMIHSAYLGYSWYIAIIAFIFVLLAALAAGATRTFAFVDTEANLHHGSH